MAAAVGTVGGGCGSSWVKLKGYSTKNKTTKWVCVRCVSSSSGSDPYKTLKIQRGASESEVKKAFRKLALQYHPDVCRESNCGVQFHCINEAYDTRINNVKDGELRVIRCGIDETIRGMNDPDWDMWEEWMGWEGAGIHDYSSHINPYI